MLRLAEAGLSGLDLALDSPHSFGVVAWSWVRRADKRPLSKLQLAALFLLLQGGSHRQLVDASVASAAGGGGHAAGQARDAVPSRKK